MKQREKKLVALLLSVILTIALPLSALGLSVRADEEEQTTTTAESSQTSETSEASETSESSEATEPSDTSATSETSESAESSETSETTETTAPTEAPDYFYISGHGNYDAISSQTANVNPGWSYCLDQHKSSPNVNHKYTRTTINDSGFSDETNLMLLSFAYNRDALVDYIRQMAAGGNYIAARFISIYDTQSTGRGAHDTLFTYFVWGIVYSDAHGGTPYYSTSDYRSRAISLGGVSDDPLNDPNSYYNAFLVPVYQFLTVNGISFNEYNANLYICVDSGYQRILGDAYRLDNPDVAVTNPNPVFPDFPVPATPTPRPSNTPTPTSAPPAPQDCMFVVGKGVQDTNGDWFSFSVNNPFEFELDVQVIDAALAPVPNLTVTLVRYADDYGNLAYEQVTTDSNGVIVLPMRASEQVALMGFDSFDYSFIITENLSVMPSWYSLSGYYYSNSGMNPTQYPAGTPVTFTGYNDIAYALNIYDASLMAAATATTTTSDTTPSDTTPSETTPSETTPAVDETTAASTTAAVPVETQAPFSGGSAAALVETTVPTESSVETSVLDVTRTQAQDQASDSDTQVLGADRAVNSAVPDTGEDVSAMTVAGTLMIVLSFAVYSTSVRVKHYKVRKCRR